MDTSSFHVQSTLEANYLHIVLEEPIRLDEIAVKVLKEDCPDFLLPFRMTDRDGRLTLKYRLTNAAALAYSSMTFKKNDFLKLYASLFMPFINGADWFLDYHYICIDPSYVYLSKDLSETYYLYIPEDCYRNSDEEIIRFFQHILDQVVIVDDKSFLVEWYQYFNRGQVTLAGLYAMIQKESKVPAGTVSVPHPSEGAAVNLSVNRAHDIVLPAAGGIGDTEKAGVPECVNEREEKKEKTKKRKFFGAKEEKKEKR